VRKDQKIEVITTKVSFFLAPSPTSSQNQAHAQDEEGSCEAKYLIRKKKTEGNKIYTRPTKG
tara:strand:- start:2261 stop:2446 length:186 start_codon:yes stop_codon:yes gene_type:complete